MRGVSFKVLPMSSNGQGTAHKGPGPRSMDMIIVELEVDVCDSMGANLVNTVCEGVAPFLAEITGGRVGLKILTNLCTKRRAGASFLIPISKLATDKMSGEEVSERILEAYLFAVHDPSRTATHNKGVMNGIDAVAIATGQDWRSLNAAIYSDSFSTGRYRPITSYRLVEVEGLAMLEGSIDVPISVGVKGGATQSNPLYQQNLQMLNSPSSAQLSQIIVSVGLAQNFAALRALTAEGIQKGHMRLHSRNLAMSAGVPMDLVEAAVEYMISKKMISSEGAQEFLMIHFNSSR